ncbi:ATP-binding cassette domain-containing protein [Peptostreptococcus sp. D1]|uniref:ATP-binding cassette domain-containing protein n=1 Tax=Peptostreptococcus sp. D1 TaxID=72304 RepID=UPI0008E8B7C8|nr:ABC transporter ATP-binding protein [Peptostreptococcus sp. D1]SFE67029.1 ABC-type multidrug transport system, ATPase and permease component [Peptostreptococcus sp. D1]
MNKYNEISNLKKIIKILLETDKKNIFIMSIDTIISSLIPALSLTIMQSVLNKIQNDVDDFKYILMLLATYILLDLFTVLKDNMIDIYNAKFKMILNRKIKIIILDKTSELSLKDFEDSNIYDKIQRAQESGAESINTYVSIFFSISKNILTILSYIYILINFNVWLVLLIMIIPILEFMIMKAYNIENYHININRTNDKRKLWYIEYMCTRENYFKEIKLNSMFFYLKEKYIKYISEFMHIDLNIIKKYKKYLILTGILESIIDGLIYVYIVYCGFTKVILIGNVITYTRSLTQIKSLISLVLEDINDIKKMSLDLNLFFSFIEYNKNEKYNEKEVTVKSINSIEIENLNYRYDTNKELVLKNINLKLKPHSKNIIVGKNGSGKTTLLKIILGFYDDYEGIIKINSINLKDIEKKSYMECIGALFQDYVKYESSYFMNIALGDISRINDKNRIDKLIKEFSIDNIINCKNDTINSQIGYWFNEGSQISEGQWQKIAIARTFFKNASVFILDEPNSALDVITENDIEEEYMRYMDKKISIIVIHRFKKIVEKDVNIIVMDKGKIVDEGKHNELLDRCRIYRDLYENI